MRILLVQESDWLERGPHQQHHLVERLKKRGHEIRIIDFEIEWKNQKSAWPFSGRQHLKAPGKALKEQVTCVIRPALIRVPLLIYLSVIVFHFIEIIRQIKSFKPDLIIGMGIVNTFLASKISRFFHVPFVYYLIDSLHTLIPERSLKSIGRLFVSLTIRNADRVLVINKHLGDYTKKLCASSNPTIIAAGIDRTRFNPDINGTVIRRSLGISDKDVILFFMGWLYEFSGLKEVALDLVSQESNMKLLILGRGDLYDQLHEIAKAKTIGNKVIMVDWVPYEEVPQYLNAADICILPAYKNEIMRDIVPIKMYEYLACAKPVIATRLPGIMKEFGQGNGVIYIDEPQDVLMQAKKIYENPAEYQRLSKAALKFCESFDWKLVTDKFESFLYQLLLEY